MRAPLLLASLVAACASTPLPPTAPPSTTVPPPPSDCPDAPAIELYVETAAGPGEALHVGGHITAIDSSRDEDGGVSLVGTLDVKGTLAFERVTRDLALANYAATQRGEPARRLTLALHDRPLAALAVLSALRGRRFRLPALVDAATPFTDDTRDALDAALRVDRRCFPGR